MKNVQQPSFRNLYAFGRKLPIDLSLSENPLGCSPEVKRVIRQLTQDDFFDYPDPDCIKLKRALARKFRLKVNNFFVANGSEAIIKLICQVILKPQDEVIIPRLTFPMFEIASTMNKATVILSDMTSTFDIDLNAMASNVTKKTKLIVICNPNNPTGKVISKKALIGFVKRTDAFVVVDEANIEFGGKTIIQEIRTLPNLIVLRTFSKGFGLAGFRIGFCVSSINVIQSLQIISQPFPVSTMAEKAALVALKDTVFIKKSKRFMKRERDFLTGELRKRNFTVLESQANNLLVFPPLRIFDLVEKLSEKGVSVVDGVSFSSLHSPCMRVSPRLRKTNETFLQVIDQIIGKTEK